MTRERQRRVEERAWKAGREWVSKGDGGEERVRVMMWAMSSGGRLGSLRRRSAAFLRAREGRTPLGVSLLPFLRRIVEAREKRKTRNGVGEITTG